MFAGFGLGVLAADEPTARWCQSANITLFLALPAAYLLFLATVESPLARPLRARATRLGIVIATVLLEAAWIARPDLFLAGMTPTSFARYDFVPGPAFNAFEAVLLVLLLYSLAIAISAWRLAPVGTAARRRAAGYAVAYGARDSLLVIALAGFTWAAARPATEPPKAAYLLVPIANLVGSLLLGYAILRTQLFDIDLRIKRGIERSTVVTIVAVLSIVTGKIVDHYAQGAFGWYAAIGVAIGMLFFTRGLERVGTRVANTALPQVQPTSSYLSFKKLEVYKAAVETALENDGIIDARERAMLERLRASLDVASEDARAVEEDALTRAGRAASSPADGVGA